MILSLPFKDSMDSHPIYTLPHECAKSIRKSFLRTGHAMSLSLRRKRSKVQSTFSKVITISRKTSTNSMMSTSSTNMSSDSHGIGFSPVLSASSSLTQLSDLTTTETTTTTTQSPSNQNKMTPQIATHPPVEVFANADQGYSMFYRKLPNGNWIVRCRTADRKIIATYEVNGSMI